MSPEPFSNVHLVLGYVVWLLCFGVYIWPRLKAMDRSKRSALSLPCTAFASSGWSSSFRALPAICRPVSPTSPLTVTSRPGCLPSWRF